MKIQLKSKTINIAFGISLIILTVLFSLKLYSHMHDYPSVFLLNSKSTVFYSIIISLTYLLPVLFVMFDAYLLAKYIAFGDKTRLKTFYSSLFVLFGIISVCVLYFTDFSIPFTVYFFSFLLLRPLLGIINQG